MHPFQSEMLVPHLLDDDRREATARRHRPTAWRRVAGTRFVHAGERLSRFGRRLQSAGTTETTACCVTTGA